MLSLSQPASSCLIGGRAGWSPPSLFGGIFHMLRVKPTHLSLSSVPSRSYPAPTQSRSILRLGGRTVPKCHLGRKPPRIGSRDRLWGGTPKRSDIPIRCPCSSGSAFLQRRSVQFSGCCACACAFWENSRMNPPKFCSVLLPFLVASTLGWSQACPKVTLTSSTQQTIQGLVFAVNCLIDVSEQARSNLPQNPKPGLLARSEEHTSELQSRLHLVCRLLLEKKKQINDRPIRVTNQ